MKAETQLLREQAVEPTDRALEEALGETLFGIYRELIGAITGELGMEYGWRYYNDGKAWLCKTTFRKKTVFWLSAWEGAIRTSFYFTEKTRAGIYSLAINGKIKADFEKTVASGKLVPLILHIDRKEQLADVLEIVKYKKSLK